MWRKQSETKAPLPAETHVPPLRSAPEPAPAREPAGRVAAPSETSDGTRIGKSLSVKGEITGREQLFLDGELQGTIRLEEAKLTVGPNGRVSAEIEAREIHVQGTVRGTLYGHERVEIGRSATVTGEILTHRIVIEEGAIFRGTVDIIRPGEARKPRQVAAAAAAGAAPGKRQAEVLQPVSAEAEDTVQ